MAFQETFQIFRALPLGAKDEVTRLKNRPNVAQAEIRGEVAQGSHGNLLVTAKVDRAKQGDKRAHLLAYALSKVGRSSFSISRTAFMTLSAFSG